jgi:hypothetical protein
MKIPAMIVAIVHEVARGRRTARPAARDQNIVELLKK